MAFELNSGAHFGSTYTKIELNAVASTTLPFLAKAGHETLPPESKRGVIG